MAEQAPKRRGPKKQHGERDDLHLMLPKDLIEAIDAISPGNRTAWIVQAIEEKLQREQR